VDVFATELVFTRPVSIVTVAIPTAALDVHVIIFSNGTTETTTSTRILTVLPTTTSAITFEYSGVPLTWPTTYLAYTAFLHETVNSVCQASVTALTLPTPTDWADLIYPANDTPGPSLPPSALINFLNEQPTIIAQLSGTPIGQSCDPIVGALASPTAVLSGDVQYTTTYQEEAPIAGTTDTTSVIAQSEVTATSLAIVGGGTTTLTSTSTAPVNTASVITPAVVGSARTSAAQPQQSSNAGTTLTTSRTSGNGTSSIPLQVSSAGAERAAEAKFIGVEGWLAGALGVGAGLGML